MEELTEAETVACPVLLTVVTEGVMERQEQAADTLLDPYADRYAGKVAPARFSLFAGGADVVTGRPKVEVTEVVLKSGFQRLGFVGIRYTG